MTLANIHVGVDQKVRIDLKLELGQMTETVEIQAETPLVQTSSSDLSATIERRADQDAAPERPQLREPHPHHPRRPAAASGRQHRRRAAAWPGAPASGFSANGQRPRDNNYLLDGVDNNETWLQTVVIFPSVDALDEFKMQTSTYSAEFGKSLGGVVNLQIKSGSNSFHGSVYDFLRNDAFDANNFFNNRAGRAKPDFKQHQFGATLGGPIIKDKTFFFGSYQGLRLNQGLTYLSTVPTDADAAGQLLRDQPGHLRPADRPALPGQHHPAEPVRPAVAGTSSTSSIPAAEHGRDARRNRPDHQQLPDQPDPRARRTTRSTSRSTTT